MQMSAPSEAFPDLILAKRSRSDGEAFVTTFSPSYPTLFSVAITTF